ncbi:MAG: proton-conducting transporter membrane subunit [Lamprobacter sp.]|uniref:proton-conducting transporter transmembrane domain-containing protein n=1 Tax=Lamprobacter sp. TaxID=3100796 RepID=UPI002B25ED1F|nr:proton-conducting transporter membrane subunit [Lamprobacter sp.]MEA3638867.1 proton-conducting transporter membrane subunit [Lamprobacter sp.]
MSVASLLATLGQWAPLLVLVTPLTLAGLLAFPRLASIMGVLAPWAVLPALLAGLSAPQTELFLPQLLLGSSLMIDPIGRPFLVLLALLWLIAGWLAGDRLRRRGRALLFLLAMSGSLGLIVAGNLVVFLLASTVSGYALYGLAVRQPGARAFVVLLVLSDLLLFELLLLLVKGGIGLSLAPATAPSAAIGGSLVLLLLTLLGFGAKAAVFGLHAWLPRLLSGAAVELSPMLIGFVLAAGLLPWLRLLAPGALSGADARLLLAWIALTGLGLAVLLGLLQSGRRALLGYTLCGLSGFWLLLLTMAGGELGRLMPAAEAEARALAMALALGQAGLALAALLVQGARRWSKHLWLDWLLNGFTLLLLIDALLSMTGVLAFETENGFMIAACGLFGGLLGRLLWAGSRGTETLQAIEPSRPVTLSLMAAGWALLVAAGTMIAPLSEPLAAACYAPVSAPRAAVALIVAATFSALLAPWLARRPQVPPGDLLIVVAHWLLRRFR